MTRNARVHRSSASSSLGGGGGGSGFDLDLGDDFAIILLVVALVLAIVPIHRFGGPAT